MEFLTDPGTAMSKFIFWGSSFLTEERALGLVSIGILIGLLVAGWVVGDPAA